MIECFVYFVFIQAILSVIDYKPPGSVVSPPSKYPGSAPAGGNTPRKYQLQAVEMAESDRE